MFILFFPIRLPVGVVLLAFLLLLGIINLIVYVPLGLLLGLVQAASDNDVEPLRQLLNFFLLAAWHFILRMAAVVRWTAVGGEWPGSGADLWPG